MRRGKRTGGQETGKGPGRPRKSHPDCVDSGHAAAVIVAAGTGSRMGRPKQFLEVAGRPLVHWSADAFLKLQEIKEIVIVLNPEQLKERGRDWPDSRVKTVAGGETRLDSVRIGLRALSAAARLVAVHDGARPLVSPDLIRECLKAADKYGAALLAVPAKETLKEVEGQGLFVISTPDRTRYWAAQTPQCYRVDVLRKALRKFERVKEATDESQLVEATSVQVKVVPSSYENIKVTTPDDLAVAEVLLQWRGMSDESRILHSPKALAQEPCAPGACVRTGFGYDIHRLVEGRPLLLAGVLIDHPKGLLGHSDGDVVLHAVSDALLGAAGAGEIGLYFPPTDPSFKGIASVDILRKALAILHTRRGRIEHLDVAVIAEEPKLKDLYPRLQANLSRLLRIPKEKVNLKAKSQEGLGEIGRGEAIACYAVATITIRPGPRAQEHRSTGFERRA